MKLDKGIRSYYMNLLESIRRYVMKNVTKCHEKSLKSH